MGKERLWSPVFVLIVVFTFCSFFVGQGANAGTSVYLEITGGSSGLAGIGALVFSLAAAVSRIVSGPLADHRGRALTMLVGAVCMLVGAIGPLLGNDDVLFIVWRIFQGFGFAAATTAVATAAADVLPASRLGEGIGYSGLGQALAMSVGPALAIFLISTDVPQSFYVGIGVVALFAAILALSCRYEKNPESLPESSMYRRRWERGEVPRAEGGAAEPRSSAEAGSPVDDAAGSPSHDSLACDGASNDCDPADSAVVEKPRSKPGAFLHALFEPKALPGAIPLMFLSAAYGFSIFFMGTFGAFLGVMNAGIYYTIAAVTMLLVRLASGRFMDSVAPLKIMGVAVLTGVVCYGMLFCCTLLSDAGLAAGGACEWLFYLAGIPYGISMGLSIPVNQSIAVKLSPPSRWGAANGLFYLLYDIAIGTVSMGFGFTIAACGYGFTIILVVVCIVLSFCAAAICYPKNSTFRA